MVVNFYTMFNTVVGSRGRGVMRSRGRGVAWLPCRLTTRSKLDLRRTDVELHDHATTRPRDDTTTRRRDHATTRRRDHTTLLSIGRHHPLIEKTEIGGKELGACPGSKEGWWPELANAFVDIQACLGLEG